MSNRIAVNDIEVYATKSARDADMFEAELRLIAASRGIDVLGMSDPSPLGTA